MEHYRHKYYENLPKHLNGTTPREEKIIERLAEGATLREVADWQDITVERVRQLAKGYISKQHCIRCQEMREMVNERFEVERALAKKERRAKLKKLNEQR